MSLLLNKMVNTPVIKIQETMAKIADGDFTRDVTIEWENEFGDIGKGINKLSESIKNLMHSRLEMEKQRETMSTRCYKARLILIFFTIHLCR